MLLGAGELGQEQIIEAQRLGIETVAVDRYENAPGQRLADRRYTINMRDGKLLREVVEKEAPDAIIPEIEAIDLDTLFELEKEGYYIVPSAKATHTAMQRKRLRELIAKEAGVLTSKYVYARTADSHEVRDGCERVGYPCVIKAIQSSSGLGSTEVRGPQDVEEAVAAARKEARGSG
ncbi:ATP-grasp domain-containing protein, partial [Candidatus Micrarchaeota archaeon]|nr:ATP-grasp domain-containing protein [Candidatus Micrarchaeota archaeon]